MTSKEVENNSSVVEDETTAQEEASTKNEETKDEPEVCTKISESAKLAGFLDKKGSMLWKRYWFVLEDKLLLYYKSQLEYLHLSPCRGSLNMSLVTAVQPRRNSKEPIIHIVSRTQTLVLKAIDRETQEKWLQALLDSIGKQGMAALRFSLDDLPGEVKTMTLPKRLHSGSLDAVWKPPVIPKTPMLDKVMAYKENADENQNTDSYITDERKSFTLDNRRMDTLNKLRNAMGKRKTSVTTPAEPKKVGKQRKESFLRKMFKRKYVKEETKDTTDDDVSVEVEASEEVAEKSLEQVEPVKENVVQESDGEDPLYDKIDPVKDAEKKKELLGFKILMPEGTLAELKNRLRSKESIHEESKEPPALPPRSFSNSLTALESTTEVVVHHVSDSLPTECEESEESEVSGHYQVIGKPCKKEDKNEVAAEMRPPVEAEYQVIDKSKKKKKRVQECGDNHSEDLLMELKITEPLQVRQELTVNILDALFVEVKPDTEVPTKDQEGNPQLAQASAEKPVAEINVDDEKEKARKEVEEGLTELNSLLARLAAITSGPLDELEKLEMKELADKLQPKREKRISDPDYDVPRPLLPPASEKPSAEDRMDPTEFFTQADGQSNSTLSLEPDSLEDKKEMDIQNSNWLVDRHDKVDDELTSDDGQLTAEAEVQAPEFKVEQMAAGVQTEVK